MVSDNSYDAADVKCLSDLLHIIEKAIKMPEVDTLLKSYENVMGIRLEITTITDSTNDQSVFIEAFGEDTYGG